MTMATDRFGLNHAMGLVVLAAVDFALLRISGLITGGAPDQFRLQMVVLTALPTANLAALALMLRAVRSGPTRRFLAGFATSAAITSALLLAGVAFLDLKLVLPPTQRLGKWMATSLWGRTDMLDTRELIILMAAFASVFSLPQALLASIVGLVVRGGLAGASPAVE